jgi:hypothetical protein
MSAPTILGALRLCAGSNSGVWFLVSEKPVQVHPVKLAHAAVTMMTVTRQLQAIKDTIDQHAHLPTLAFGGVGEIARQRYNSACSKASDQIGAHLKTARTMARTLAGNAVGYVSTEDANIEQMLRRQAGPETDLASDAMDHILQKDIGWLLSLGVSFKLYQDEYERGQDIKSSEMKEWETIEKNWVSDSDIFLKLTSEAEEADENVAVALERLSLFGKLSQATETALQASSRLALAASGAAVLWGVSAVALSDESTDKAYSAWMKISSAAKGIFEDEMPAIKEAVFRDWHGSARETAEAKFDDFIKAGNALTVQAHKMASTIEKVIKDLNLVHWLAFGFALAQVAALIISTISPFGFAYTQFLAAILEVRVTVYVNLIGMAVSIGWLSFWDVSV